MSQNDFGGAVIPAMAGLLFWKKAKVQEIRQEAKQQLPAVIAVESQALTGVARYLSALPSITGVSKYLKNQEKHQISGVERYLLKQEIAGKSHLKPTTVTKYLSNVAKGSSGRSKSSVDKYLLKLEFAEKKQAGLTGVARYTAEQNLIDKRKAATALIERYREAEKQAVLAAEESKRLAYERSVQEEIEASETPAATGLGRYLQKQSQNKAGSTGVAKYIARQIIIDSQKPQLSGVAKYLRQQDISVSKKPSRTGVSRYLSELEKKPVKERKIKLPPTRVERYLESLEISEKSKPLLTGVAKYLDKVTRIQQSQAILSLPSLDQIDDSSQQQCLEGEFIPANELSATITGVSRYLKQQEKQVVKPDSSALTPIASPVAVDKPLTGVARYLDRVTVNTNVATEKVSTRTTKVDRYIQNRA